MDLDRPTIFMRLLAVRENALLACQTLWDRKFRSPDDARRSSAS
jgi:hypothetical protein